MRGEAALFRRLRRSGLERCGDASLLREEPMLRFGKTLTCALVGLVMLGCSDLEQQKSAVLMTATVAQDVQIIDIFDAACGTLGTVNLSTIVKNPNTADTRFLDVKLVRMRVSYRRTDGGTLIPQGFTQTITGILPAGGTAVINDFFVFEVNALTLAPFVALQPQNGGHDPETGQPFVKMDVTLEIFGETLAGDPVTALTQFPLTFCGNCGGCK